MGTGVDLLRASDDAVEWGDVAPSESDLKWNGTIKLSASRLAD
jgi:hypothetical protein